MKPGPLTPSGHTPSGHGGNPPHTTTSSSGGSSGGGVSKSSGPGPDFLPPRNPGGPRLNPLHGLNNLDANNPTTNTGSGTGTGSGNSSSMGTGSGTGGSSSIGTGTGHAGSTTSTGSGHAGTGSGSGAGTGSGHASTGSGTGTTGSSGASHGGAHNSSGSPQPHTNTGSSTGSGTGTGTGTGSGHTSTGTGSAVGSGSGHASTGHGSSAGSSGANSGASQQPHANTGSGPRPDPLIEKPRPHHTPENNPTTSNGNGNTESPTSGKNPEHPHPKDLSTPTTRNNNGDTPHTHHDQETTAPSSRGNPHVHDGDSTPTNTHNPPPPTKPDHPTDPDHPTNPEHPQRQGQESSSGDVKHPPSSDDHGEGPDQPASGGNQQPRKVPGAFYDEDGRPLHDKDGKPLEVDHGDGKRHYASDPADTYRDSQNALQNNEGGYSKDPYTGWDKDVDAFNDREPSTNHPWDDPTHDDNYHTDRQKRTDLDTIAHEKAETAKTTFNDLKSYGIKPEGKSFRKLERELTKEIIPKLAPKDLGRAFEIRDTLVKAAKASEDAGRASEWLGERAASHRNKDLGRDTIIGDPPDNPRDFTRTGPGKVDAAAIEGDTTFVVDEAKSGNSPNYPSRRTENGVRAQQGTLEYITDLLTGKNQDPRILENLTRLKQEGKHPKFFENLAAGKVELNYELIQARTNGNVTASNFRIAPPGGKIMLTWDGKGDLKITIVPKGK